MYILLHCFILYCVLFGFPLKWADQSLIRSTGSLTLIILKTHESSFLASFSGGKKCRSSITERKFRKDLLVTCPSDSLLTSANIVGVNGGCEGISPELYVQVSVKKSQCSSKKKHSLSFKQFGLPVFLLF